MRHARTTLRQTLLGAVVLLVCAPPSPALAQGHAAGETPSAWSAPTTVWGAPDLQGVWDYKTATPLERPDYVADREFLTDEEVAEFERRALERADGRPPDDARTAPSVHAPYWLDYGKSVVGTKRTSLVVDPPDGRIPALSSEGERRVEARRRARRARGASDSYTDRNLWERCITRGLPTGMMPAGYNNNLQVLQTPTHVVLFNEMIHDARIVPLDDDARHRHREPLRQWRGDSRGWWEGDTLVVETTHFSPRADFRGAGDRLHLMERFTRTGPDTITYAFTVTDPSTWSAPWTVTYPIVRTDEPVFEYACHEGNYGLAHILGNARIEESGRWTTRGSTR